MTAAQNVAARIAAGTGALLRAFGTWLVGESWRDLLRRLAGTAAAAVFVGMLVYGTQWLMWPGVVWFLFAAWCAAAPDTEGEEPDDEDEEPTEGPEATKPGPALSLLPLPSLQDLHDAVVKVGTPHAHISALAEELSTTAERVREALAAHGIPVEPVRMRGRASSSTGVKGDRFPARAAPSGRVVVAGQPINNDNNNAADGPAVECPAEGMFIIRDPAETVSRRHAV